MAKTSVKEVMPPAAPDKLSYNKTLLNVLITESAKVGQVLAAGIEQAPPSLNAQVLEERRVEGLAKATELLLYQADQLERIPEFYEASVVIKALCSDRRNRVRSKTSTKPIENIACLFPDKIDPSCSVSQVKDAHKLSPKKLQQVKKHHSIFNGIPLQQRVPVTKASTAVNRRFHKNCSACKIFEYRFTPHVHGFRVEPAMAYLCTLAHAKFKNRPTVSDLKFYLTHHGINYDLETTAPAPGSSQTEDINLQDTPAKGLQQGEVVIPNAEDSGPGEGNCAEGEKAPLPDPSMDF